MYMYIILYMIIYMIIYPVNILFSKGAWFAETYVSIFIIIIVVVIY